MSTHLPGFHIQNSPDGYLAAVAKMPVGSIVKFTSGWERCIEVKATNPGVLTWVRHVTDQPMPTGDYDNVARQIFARFVDPAAPWTHHVDFVQGWNEFYANSQQPEERAHWEALDMACAKIWYFEYRQKYPHLSQTRFVMAEAAVGNDLPLHKEYARVCHTYDAVLGYHPYMLIRNGAIDPGDWRWYSGRWDWMDREIQKHGYKLDWAFGEMGPHASAADGWRSSNCLGGSMPAYLDALEYWCNNVAGTQADQEGRVLGGVLFTCGAPGGGPNWSKFDLGEREMSMIADWARQYEPPVVDPPKPPPEPPQDKPRGAPRVQYAREVWVAPDNFTEDEFAALARAAYRNKRTVGFSHDDAGVGDLDKRTAVLFNVPSDEHDAYRKWYAEHYPGVVVEFDDVYQAPPPKPPLTHGIDVSRWQGAMDWDKAIAEGVTFGFVKATDGLINSADGKMWIDPQFLRNWEILGRKNITRGAYHYLRNRRDHVEQARHFIATVAHDLRPDDYLIVDIEDTTHDPQPEKILQFLRFVEEVTAIVPMIYTSPGYWRPLENVTPWAAAYPLWVAAHTTATRPLVPRPWETWTFWQYAVLPEGAKYGAQSSRIDLNRYNKALLG